MDDVDSFRIDVPAAWQQLPLDLPSLRVTLNVDPDSESAHALDPLERRRIDLYLQRLIADIESVDARFVAIYSDAYSGDDGAAAGDAEETQLVASIVASVLDRSTMGSALPLSPAIIQSALSMTDEEVPALASLRTTNLAEPTIVELPHATAVLERKLVELQYSKTDKLSIASETYFVPIADAYERMVVMQFSTPNLGDAEIFSELFGAIASTLTFYREGEETTL